MLKIHLPDSMSTHFSKNPDVLPIVAELNNVSRVLPSTTTGLTGSMRDTISARSVKEALGHVTTWKTQIQLINSRNSFYSLKLSFSHQPNVTCMG